METALRDQDKQLRLKCLVIFSLPFSFGYFSKISSYFAKRQLTPGGVILAWVQPHTYIYVIISVF